jgi:hypothetical protein
MIFRGLLDTTNGGTTPPPTTTDNSGLGTGFTWLQPILDALQAALWPILIVVAAVGSIYAIYLGVMMAKAENAEKREEAKKRIINAVEFAHMQGAHIVALTDSALSPIATHADSTLYAKSDMASFVDSLVAPLSIMNALIVDIARKKKVELQNVFSRLETIWDEYDVYDKDSHI